MNFIIYLLSEGLSKIIPFATILVVAKFIDIESFGELSLYLIVYEMLVVVISNNISATTRIDYYRLNFADYVNSKSIHLTVSFIIFSFVSIVSAFLSTIPYYFLIIIALS